eukprot:3534501-Prymnesium_polylepis.1
MKAHLDRAVVQQRVYLPRRLVVCPYCCGALTPRDDVTRSFRVPKVSYPAHRSDHSRLKSGKRLSDSFFHRMLSQFLRDTVRIVACPLGHFFCELLKVDRYHKEIGRAWVARAIRTVAGKVEERVAVRELACRV